MQKKQTKEIIILSTFGLILTLGCLLREPEEIKTETEVQEDIQTEIEVQEECIQVQESQKERVKESIEPMKFYDVPLSKELQIHIFKECEKYNINPALIISMIDSESDFDPTKIGDNGKSFGLMQIQPIWHWERMNRLGVTDLLDPFQNVTVGIDYVAELFEQNNNTHWVLMVYNGGHLYAREMMVTGKISDYALEVTQRASELERGME